jgi:hypothetical protein
MYSQKLNCAASLFPEQNNNVLSAFYFTAAKYIDRSCEYIKIAHRHMNVEIGPEAAQFPEKKYINDIFVAVW